jgi:putative MATE family efflux protein
MDLDKSIRALFDVRRLIPCGEALGEIPENRQIYLDVIRIAWPSVIEMVTMSMIGFIDTWLVSSLGEKAIAAVGLVSQPRMLLMALFYALNVGVIAIVARRKGEDRQADANATLRNAMMMIAGLSFIMMALGLTFSTFLMNLAGAQSDTLVDSRTYFEITTWFLPVNTLTICICAAQRGVGNTRLTLSVNIVSNLVDLLFSYLLINGYGGLPRLGVAGAAWGTGVGFAAGLVMSMATVFGRHHGAGFFHLSFRDDWRPNFKILKEITDVGGGAVAEQAALRVGFFTYAAIVANLGTAVFAAHQICAQFQNLSFTFGDGIGVAGTSLVGQSLGRKRSDMAKLYGIASQRMALVVALVMATSIVIFRHQLVGIFSDDAYIAGLAAKVMLLLAIFQPFQTSSVVVSGALRGAGDTRFVARVMLLCVGLMRPLLALLAVFVLSNVFGRPEIALLGAWAAAIIDMATRVTLVYRRFSGGKWCDIKV